MKFPISLRNNSYKLSIFLMPAILAIGFAIRLIGIGVGLPYTPDPRETLIAEDVLNLINFTAPPEIYNWPGTAWFYLIALVGKALSICRIRYDCRTRVIWIARVHQCPVINKHNLGYLLSWNVNVTTNAWVRLLQDFWQLRCCMLPTNRVLHLLTYPPPSV